LRLGVVILPEFSWSSARGVWRRAEELGFDHASGLYAAAGATDFVVHWPRRNEPYAGDPATFEHIVSCTSAAAT